jgi:hypothetical protein
MSTPEICLFAVPLAAVIMTERIDIMIRTQISLHEHEYALAQAEAKAMGISLAEFVRRAIRDALPEPDSPWMKYAGFVESGDAGSSQSADDIVYGSKD